MTNNDVLPIQEIVPCMPASMQEASKPVLKININFPRGENITSFVRLRLELAWVRFLCGGDLRFTSAEHFNILRRVEKVTSRMEKIGILCRLGEVV